MIAIGFDVHKAMTDYDADVSAALANVLDLSPASVCAQAKALVQPIEKSATLIAESALGQMRDCVPRPIERVGRGAFCFSGRHDGSEVGWVRRVATMCFACLVGAHDLAMWFLGLDPPSVVAEADATLGIAVGGVAA